MISYSQPSLDAVQKQIRSTLSSQDLRHWTTLTPGRVYRDLALSWIGIFAALVVVSKFQGVWAYGFAFLLIGSCQYALFILGHDGLHGLLHPSRIINDRLARWFIYGSMFMAMEDGRRNHLEHHRTLGTTADPDRYLHTLAAKNTQTSFLLFCSGLATFGKTVIKVTPFGKLLEQKAKSEVQPRQSSKPKASSLSILVLYFKQRIPVFVVQSILLGMFLALQLPWWSYFVLWIGPIYFCVFLADEIRAFCDHAVLDLDDVKADPHRLITFRPSWFEAVIFSPHNMNYHAEHHLFPSVPYYNLPKAHAAIRHESGVTVRSSYIAFLLQVLRFLPRS